MQICTSSKNAPRKSRSVRTSAGLVSRLWQCSLQKIAVASPTSSAAAATRIRARSASTSAGLRTPNGSRIGSVRSGSSASAARPVWLRAPQNVG